MKVDNQNPSFTNVEFKQTYGDRAIETYGKTGNELFEWQKRQIRAIEAVNDSNEWKYINYGLCVSRRNGKGEVLVAREMDGIVNIKEKVCHTAHRTTTSHDAFLRLYDALKKAGYVEHNRKKKNMPENSFFASKQYGLEHIEISGGGSIEFRTRTDSGGLGEGFDLLIIDEAQEYTSKQESALQYTVSDSDNPQIILTGTPPTVKSGGDVLVRIRNKVLDKSAFETGWAEWSTPEYVKGDAINDVELWKLYNPSFGLKLSERKIRNELSGDQLDFNIQRLGFWVSFNQKSCISEKEWVDLKLSKMPKLQDARYIGIKYGRDGVNVAMSIAAKTEEGKIFVETIDCVSVRAGNRWIFEYFNNPKLKAIAIDGASGQKLLADEMKDKGIRLKPILPSVGEIINSNALFEQNLFAKNICHMGQESLKNVVTNCDKRLIGSKGGFGYKSLVETQDIAIMDSMILAAWLCATNKNNLMKQKINI
jgi:phage terminase large subunit-like protein